MKKILRPLAGDSHRRASVDIHQYLRDSILANALPPETILSQVEVADCLKVSRTPVREALRMLKEEGLVKAEPNFRCRVLGFDPRELEALYVSRIMNEGISATITVQSMSDADIVKLAELLRQLRKDEKQHNLSPLAQEPSGVSSNAIFGRNPLLQKRMNVDCQRSERYVYNSIQSGLVDIYRRAAVEHCEILQACKKRQSALVAALLTRHLSRAGIDILTALAPHWDPVTLRTAAEFMLGGAIELDDRNKR